MVTNVPRGDAGGDCEGFYNDGFYSHDGTNSGVFAIPRTVNNTYCLTLGQPFTYNNEQKLTVLDAVFNMRTRRAYTPYEGDIFVLARVRLENISDYSLKFSSNDFRISDNNDIEYGGYRQDTSLYFNLRAAYPHVGERTTPPGEAIEAVIPFIVFNNAEYVDIQYLLNRCDGQARPECREYAVWRLYR